jgi:outer membrane protein TolC
MTMRRVHSLTRLSGSCLGLFFLFLSFPGQSLLAQVNFEYFLDSARINNSELVSLRAQRNYLKLESNMIHASNLSPKVYLSSDYLFTPYFNNNGKFITGNPEDKAIGYDINITDGGLYALLLNLEYPVFNHTHVNSLLGQNMLEIAKINTRIKTVELELEHSLANMYLDALAMQSGLQNAEEILDLLSEQLKIVKTLTLHGLYSYLDYKLMETAAKTDSIDYLNAKAAYGLSLGQLRTACGITDTSMSLLAPYEIMQEQPVSGNSLFLKTYQEDSLASIWQQKVFDSQYRPQVKLFANSGLNSATIPYMGHHVGMGAGVQLTCNLFDGGQKNINRQQQMFLIDEASRLKELKYTEVKSKLESYKTTIESTKVTVRKEMMLNKEYDELLLIYGEELKNAQVSIIDYLNFLQQYSRNKLSLNLHQIALYKLINEYNYWSH